MQIILPIKLYVNLNWTHEIFQMRYLIRYFNLTVLIISFFYCKPGTYFEFSDLESKSRKWKNGIIISLDIFFKVSHMNLPIFKSN